jgi:hypothetical protein
MAAQGWAQLVSTSDVTSDPVIIRTDKFTIGRGYKTKGKSEGKPHCHVPLYLVITFFFSFFAFSYCSSRSGFE